MIEGSIFPESPDFSFDSFEEESKEVSDRTDYPLKPLIFDAEEANQDGTIEFLPDGSMRLRHQDLEKYTGRSEEIIGLRHQRLQAVEKAFQDLERPFTYLANSSSKRDGKDLKEWFDEEKAHFFEEKDRLGEKPGRPNYGTYMYDHFTGTFMHIPPKQILDNAYIASSGDMLRDPEKLKSLDEIQEMLRSQVVGFMGASVGGNIFETYAKFALPRDIKIADVDDTASQNKPRMMGADFTNYVPSEEYIHRTGQTAILKTHMRARAFHLYYPHTRIHIYPNIHEENIRDFVLGNAKEPALHQAAEEVDKIDFKLFFRQQVGQFIENGDLENLGVLTLSDFGFSVDQSYHLFRKGALQIGRAISDENLSVLHEQARTGGKYENIRLAEAIYGVYLGLKNPYTGQSSVKESWHLTDYSEQEPEFRDWLNGEGRVNTSSIPQPLMTPYAAAAKGALTLALAAVGHSIPSGSSLNLRS